MTRWKSFTIETRRDAVEALTHFFLTQGSLGMAYDERKFGVQGDPSAPLPPPEETTKLTAYFPWESDLRDLKKAFLDFLPVLAESFGPGAGSFLSAGEITDYGWAETWKEHFKARKIGRRLVVKPSWETYFGKPEDVVVTVDPGQAFGTGTHETTRMCLRLLEDAFDVAPPPRTALDIGTGTGILGIAAALLGSRRTLGIDVDPKAVEVAGENAKANGVAERFAAASTPLSVIAETYDLILANLLAEILIDLKKEIVARCAPGGGLILSGILTEKSGWVEEEFLAEGARRVKRKTENQWAALLLRRDVH